MAVRTNELTPESTQFTVCHLVDTQYSSLPLTFILIYSELHVYMDPCYKIENSLGLTLFLKQWLKPRVNFSFKGQMATSVDIFYCLDCQLS